MTERVKWDRESDKHLDELWKNGMSIDDIAEKMGRTVSSVQSRASRSSLGRQPGDRSRFAPKTADGKVYWTADEDAALTLMMRDKIDREVIAQRLGRTLLSVNTRWTRLAQGGSPRIVVSARAKMRVCMKCRVGFSSDHAGIRHCEPCRKMLTYDAWQADL